MSCAKTFGSSAALALLVAWTATPPSLAAQQAPPTFAGGTEAVVVDVLVTRDGAPITGLTAADFTIRDTGVAQKVELAAVSAMPVRLLLALDASASVRGEALDQLKLAARAAVDSLRVADEAALLSFAQNLALSGNWTADRAALAAAIDGVSARGSTALADAAFAGLGLAPRQGVRTLMLLFTDGSDTASWLSPDRVLQAARRSDAVVYAVTIGPKTPALPPIDQLEQWLLAEPSLYRGALLPVLARHTGGEAIRAADTRSLRDTFVQIVSRFNARYVLTFTPPAAAPKGWHQLEVEVRGGGEITARRGYYR